MNGGSHARLLRNVSRSQVDHHHPPVGASAGQAHRDSISIDRKPLANKIILNSQNGGGVPPGSQAAANNSNFSSQVQGLTPIGSMPQAHAIYGQSSSTNNPHNHRNYRGNRSKHGAEASKGSVQLRRPLGGNAAGQNNSNHHPQQLAPIGGKPV